MKRYCTLIGGIIGVVIDAIYVIFMIAGLTAILDLLGETIDSDSLIMPIIDTVVVALALIFNAISITAYSSSHEKYMKNKRPILLIAVLLDSFIIGSCFVNFVTALSVLDMVLFIVSLAVVILFVIDHQLEEKRYLNTLVTEGDDEENK